MPTQFQKRLATLLVGLLTCICLVCFHIGLNKALQGRVASAGPPASPNLFVESPRHVEKSVQELEREAQIRELENSVADLRACWSGSKMGGLRFRVNGVVWVNEKVAIVGCQLERTAEECNWLFEPIALLRPNFWDSTDQKFTASKSMLTIHDDKFRSGEARQDLLLGVLTIPVEASFISFEYGTSGLITPLFRLPGRPEVLARADARRSQL